MRKPVRLLIKGLLVAVATALVLGAVAYFIILFISLHPVPTTYAIALGDLNDDGRLDAFYANGQNEGTQPNTILLNQGGRLVDSGQRLGKEESSQVALADLDGDGDLDAWVANIGYNSTFINNGTGRFSSGQGLYENALMGSALWSIALGDLDGDGDVDALGGGCCGAVSSFGDGTSQLHYPYSMLWLNQGGSQGGKPGSFSQSGRAMESLGAAGAALGDLNGDGYLDAFFANDSFMNQDADLEIPRPDTVWWNDGQANFTDSGQRLGAARASDVALGDLDGDGDFDAFITNNGPNEVWLNAGGMQGGQPGIFLDSEQRLGGGYNQQVFLAYLDDDSDLDAAIVVLDAGIKSGYHLEVWLNDGQAGFTDSGFRFHHPSIQAFALGDLDGDNRIDILGGWFEAGYIIWWNQGGGKFIK